MNRLRYIAMLMLLVCMIVGVRNENMNIIVASGFLAVCVTIENAHTNGGMK